MITERVLFCPDFATSEQAQMTRYSSMLETDILQFVSTQRYGTLVELQEAARWWEFELELQTKELWQAPMQSQPAVQGH